MVRVSCLRQVQGPRTFENSLHNPFPSWGVNDSPVAAGVATDLSRTLYGVRSTAASGDYGSIASAQ